MSKFGLEFLCWNLSVCFLFREFNPPRPIYGHHLYIECHGDHCAIGWTAKFGNLPFFTFLLKGVGLAYRVIRAGSYASECLI